MPGIEAALAVGADGPSHRACSRSTADSVGQMSCNPAIGGVAKGQIVREIDALGGAMGLLTDATAIQFRLLNRGKGPAMHSPRAQCDKKAYQALAKLTVENQANLTLRQEMVEGLEVDQGRRLGRPVPGRRRSIAPGRWSSPRAPSSRPSCTPARARPRADGRGTWRRDGPLGKPPEARASSCDGSRRAPRRGSTAGRSISPGWNPSRATTSRSRSRS